LYPAGIHQVLEGLQRLSPYTAVVDNTCQAALDQFCAFANGPGAEAVSAQAHVERKDLSAIVKASSGEEVIELAFAILATGSPWRRFFAYELIYNHKQGFSALTESSVERLGEGIDSWWAVDMFGSLVSGKAWRLGIVSDACIHRWAASPDRWWRRAALVSATYLNMKSRGGLGDAARTLDICDRLIGDRDDMVVKAMSWALRTLSGPCRAETEAWLEANRSRLAARARRQLDTKLRTGLKNPKENSPTFQSHAPFESPQ
jgi:3-methyladenine DNA glycosylase AlkD